LECVTHGTQQTMNCELHKDEETGFLMTHPQVHKSWVPGFMMTILYGGAQYLWDFNTEFFHVNCLVPRIVGRFLDFWKFCVPLV